MRKLLGKKPAAPAAQAGHLPTTGGGVPAKQWFAKPKTQQPQKPEQQKPAGASVSAAAKTPHEYMKDIQGGVSFIAKRGMGEAGQRIANRTKAAVAKGDIPELERIQDELSTLMEKAAMAQRNAKASVSAAAPAGQECCPDCGRPMPAVSAAAAPKITPSSVTKYFTVGNEFSQRIVNEGKGQGILARKSGTVHGQPNTAYFTISGDGPKIAAFLKYVQSKYSAKPA